MSSVYRSAQGKAIVIKRYNEVLGLWPAPNEQMIIPTSFGDTFVIVSGKEGGDPVVLLHGSSTNAAMWIFDAAVLGKTRRVYAVDIIGEPGNSAENRPDYKEATYAKWLVELFDGLGLKSAAVVGNSLGGWLALTLAAYAPERLESLVVLAPAGLAPIRTSFLLKAVLYSLLGKKGSDRLNSLVFGNVQIPEEALQFGNLLLQYYIPRAPQKLPVYSDAQLNRLDMPVLFFGGENDPLINTSDSAKKLSRLVPHADIRILKNMSHSLINMGADIAAFLDCKKGLI